VVANLYSNTVSVLLGNGDGTFQAARNFAAGPPLPVSVAVGEFDGDGKHDLVVANSTQEEFFHSNTVSVLLGTVGGTLPTGRTFAAASSPGAVAVGEFDGDAKAVLAVANALRSGNVVVLLGNGDGSFQAVRQFTAQAYAESVAVGDFNGDGKPDL